MAFQNTGYNRRRDPSVRPQFYPVLGRPGVLHYNLHDEPQNGNYLHGQPCLSGTQDYHSHIRHNELNVQRNSLHLHQYKQVQPAQQSNQWRQQADRTPGRRRQRLSYSRWHMMISSRYKTELCRQFSEDGDCPFEDKCLFAHGQDEIRALPRHPKYKTELCRDFHQDGFCSFGPRCNFVHSTTDVASLSANLRQKSTWSIPDSGNESCDDHSGSGSSVSSTPTPDHIADDETFFHFPESLYRELTEDEKDCF